MRDLRQPLRLITMVACLRLSMHAAAGPLIQGSQFRLPGRTVELQQLSSLPFVENEYSRRFKFDRFDNPKLNQLRLRYGLDEVVHAGTNEFDRQVRLMDWTHQQFKKFGHPSIEARGALEILNGISDGHTFFCSQYAQVLVSAAASLGWVDRPLALRRHQGVAKVGGSTEHSVTEIWSNQYAKWVMLDPTSNLYLEKDGTPLNAYEIRQEWFYHGGTNLVFVVGKEHQRFQKKDLPVHLQNFENFGELSIQPDELDKYGFTAYIPNTDLMDSGFDYGGMFMVKDRLCDGTKWHIRDVPKNPATDPYFPLGQSTLQLFEENSEVRVAVKTMTPNFKTFEVRLDGSVWSASPQTFTWNLHDGSNRLEVRSINRFGVPGPLSTAVLEVTP